MGDVIRKLTANDVVVSRRYIWNCECHIPIFEFEVPDNGMLWGRGAEI